MISTGECGSCGGLSVVASGCLKRMTLRTLPWRRTPRKSASQLRGIGPLELHSEGNCNNPAKVIYMTMTNSENKWERFGLALPAELKDAISQTAGARGQSRNGFIVDVLREYLNRNHFVDLDMMMNEVRSEVAKLYAEELAAWAAEYERTRALLAASEAELTEAEAALSELLALREKIARGEEEAASWRDVADKIRVTQQTTEDLKTECNALRARLKMLEQTRLEMLRRVSNSARERLLEKAWGPTMEALRNAGRDFGHAFERAWKLVFVAFAPNRFDLDYAASLLLEFALDPVRAACDGPAGARLARLYNPWRNSDHHGDADALARALTQIKGGSTLFPGVEELCRSDPN